MYLKLYHDTKKKTLALPRAALQLSALADAGALTLHAGHGYILTARDDLTASECVELHPLTHLYRRRPARPAGGKQPGRRGGPGQLGRGRARRSAP